VATRPGRADGAAPAGAAGAGSGFIVSGSR
jgi:hypothetical protein